jgi:hypothetical protein
MKNIEFHQNEKCYFCGRELKNFRALQDEISKQFDLEIVVHHTLPDTTALTLRETS